MKSREFIIEVKKAEAPKPRNFVAKNAKMGGAGQHKDKKKAEKQGDMKHKKQAELSEVSLGDYRKKAAMQKAQSQMGAMFARDPEQKAKDLSTFYKRERGLNRLKARDEKSRADAQAKQLADLVARLPELKAEYEAMRAEYKSLGGSDWQYADREQNLTSRERQARSMEGPMNNLWRQIQAAEKAQKSEGVEEGWKDEGDDFDEWSKYVKEKLTKAEPDQRLGIAKKLSQIEIKNFGSSAVGGFDKKTGKPTAGLGLTDTVRSALRYFNSEQDSIRRQSDQDGAPGNFSTKFGSVDIAGMENATPEELSVVKKAVGMSPIHASRAGAFYRKNGTITFKDLADIDKQIEKDSGVEFGKPMYSSPGAQASRERARMGEGSSNEYEQRQKLIKYIAQKKGWDVSDLELAKTTELVLMYKKIKEQDVNEAYIQELSSDLLASYKKKAGEQASAADKAGDYEKGNKRFKGIVKATNKQFDNDAKKNK
jgi:hypothetical protein